MSSVTKNRGVLSWALYDWANSAFATTVMAGFFPVFFKQYWSAGASVGESSFHLGAANSIASLAVLLLAPLLGAVADQRASKKALLGLFAALGIAMTAALYTVGEGRWGLAASCYALAVVGFSGSLIFYDALLVGVSRGRKLDSISALGFSMGYLGGGVLFALNVLMTLQPQWFGLNSAAEAVQLSFLTVALWWALFSLPLFRYVPEPPAAVSAGGGTALVAGFRQLASTFRQLRQLRVVFLFLLGYWLYIDGVHTVIRMAVDYGLSLGFEANSLIVALLITQFVGFPAALLFGLLGERLGPKKGIYIGIGVYLGVIAWGAVMQSAWEFYAIAVLIGLVQGGVQSLSRSFYARIIPADKSAQFFGFYNMVGKFAAVIGPVLMGWVSLATGSPRMSLLSIALLFVAGALLLRLADMEEGGRRAQEL